MIRKSKQNWEVGSIVNVGFMTGLTVMQKVPTPGDYAPDAYILKKGSNYYRFVPHKGIESISEDQIPPVNPVYNTTPVYMASF